MTPRKAGEMEVGKLYHCWRREDGKYFVATRHEDSCKVIIVLIAVLHSLSFADEEYTFGDELEAPDMPIPDVCCVCGAKLSFDDRHRTYGCDVHSSHPHVLVADAGVTARDQYAYMEAMLKKHGHVTFWERENGGEE